MGAPSIGGKFTLTAVAAAVLPFTSATFGQTTYTGTITGGAVSQQFPYGAYAGQSITISGFVNANNNGTFQCVSSTATTLVLNNFRAVAETHAGTAVQNEQYSFPSQYASKVENLIPNQQGENVVVAGVQTGDTLIVTVIGLKSLAPFDQLHGESPAFGYLQGLNDFNANPIVTDNSAGGTATVTAVAITAPAYNLTSVAAEVGGSTTYTGVITGGAANAYAGLYFTVAGFENVNNGTYLCTASTATTLVLSNSNGVLEAAPFLPTASATAFLLTVTATNTFAAGSEVVLSGLYESWLNGPVVLAQATGSAFIVNYENYEEGYTNPAEPATAKATGAGGNTWVLLAHLNLALSDYTYSSIPPTAPAPWPSCNWGIDGYYPSVYVFACFGAVLPSAITLTETVSPPYVNPPITATYTYTPQLKINVNSCYDNGIDPPADLAAGKPIFDGGVNIAAFDFTGMVGAATDGGSTNISDPTSTVGSNNPALGTPIVTTGTGDLVFALGLQKNANGLGQGTDVTLTNGYSTVGSGKLVGTTGAHYVAEWGIQTAAGSWTPQFANPIGYDTIIAAVAIQHT